MLSQDMYLRRMRIGRILGLELRKRRISAGYTQTQLARLLEVNTKTVQSTEGYGLAPHRCASVAVVYAWVKTCGGSLADAEALMLLAVRSAETRKDARHAS